MLRKTDGYSGESSDIKGCARAGAVAGRRAVISLFRSFILFPMRTSLLLSFLLRGAFTLPSGGPSTDSIRGIRADYVDTLQVPDRANPSPLATVEVGGQKIAILGYFPELIVRQNGHIVLFGLLDDSGQISRIYTKEPKATMQVATLGDQAQPCLVVRWEEAVAEGDGEAMYKYVQVWDVVRHVCLANERWAAAAGPAGGAAAGKPPVGCAADVAIRNGQLIIAEPTCPPVGAALPRIAVRVDAPGAYALVDGRLRRAPARP